MAGSYYSGMYQGAKSVVKETYNGIKQLATNPAGVVRAIKDNPGGVLKAGMNKVASILATAVTAPAIIKDAVKTGDAKTAGKAAGNILGTAIVEGGMTLATEGAGSLVRNVASKVGGKAAAQAAAGASEGVDYGKILSSTGEFDPAKTLYRGTTGSETGSSSLFLTDDAAVASTYTKNGGSVMQYDLSNSGLYMLEHSGELKTGTGIHQGSTTISTEYQFIGKDLVKAVNEKAIPHNP